MLCFAEYGLKGHTTCARIVFTEEQIFAQSTIDYQIFLCAKWRFVLILQSAVESVLFFLTAVFYFMFYFSLLNLLGDSLLRWH